MNDLQTLLQGAQQALQQGDIPSALQALTEAHEQAPARADILVHMAMLQHQSGNPAAAEQSLNAAILANPAFAPAHCNLGNLRLEQGDLSGAEDAFREALRHDPALGIAHTNIGQLKEQAGLPDQAEQAYRQALQSQPTVWLQVALSRVLAAQAKYPAALQAVRQVLAQIPKEPSACLQEGNILQRQAQFLEAAVSYRNGLTQQPDDPDLNHNLGVALLRHGQFAEAQKILKHAADLRPNDPLTAVHLATVELHLKSPEAALSALQRAAAPQPHNNILLAMLPAVLRECGQSAESDRLLAMDQLMDSCILAVPERYPDREAFHAELAAQVQALPDRYSEPATERGRQTRDVFHHPTGALDFLHDLIAAEVHRYMSHFPDGGHPIHASLPAQWSMTGWATIVREIQQGEDTHFHASAWLSGVYYVQLPPQINDAQPDAAESRGWIEFGRPANHLPLTQAPQIKIIKPETGKLLLFPSYLAHRVLPFKDDQIRISIAFDVIPKGSGANYSAG